MSNNTKRNDALAHAKRRRIATVPELPDDIPIGDIIDTLKTKSAARLARHAKQRLIPVTVHVDGPIGIHWFGDPHLDDDGTDHTALWRDVDLIQNTDGMVAASIGDQENNWVGRLGRLYADQEITKSVAVALIDEFLARVGDKWLFMIGGNHDLWAGGWRIQDYMARVHGATYQKWRCRIVLKFPNGREVFVYAKHGWKGNSMWNPAHGQMRAAQQGVTDHILIGGHKHVSGYGWVKQISGRVSHCCQVASYKLIDEYADQLGLEDGNISPSVTTIIDPGGSEASIVRVEADPEAGAEFLTWKRGRK